MQLKKHKTLHNLHMYINTKEAPVSCHKLLFANDIHN